MLERGHPPSGTRLHLNPFPVHPESGPTLSGPASYRASALRVDTPWYVPVARAIPAIALAAVITFSADHSAALGLVTFGLFAVASGAVILVAALRSAGAGVQRALLVVQGAVLMAAGAVSLAVPGAGLPFLVFLLTVAAVITGFLELYLGLRRDAPRSQVGSPPTGARGPSFGRDRVFLGGLTIVFAAVVLLVPPGFVQSFTGPDAVARQLTASVIVVGLFGAYLAIIGVYLVIAGFSLKWGTEPRTISAVNSEA